MSQYYLIGYDISDPKRLIRVHREMVRHAFALEYSIFLLNGTEHEKDVCLQSVLKLIDRRRDDVRCFQLPKRGLKARLGKSPLPQGICWTGMPGSLNEVISISGGNRQETQLEEEFDEEW